MSPHVIERLSAFLDGELPEAERREVQAHVESCPPCRTRLSELAVLDASARGLEVQAPEGYFEALPGRVRLRLRGPRRASLPAWGWAAAAALLLAVVTPLLQRDPFGPSRAPVAAPRTAPRATATPPEAPDRPRPAPREDRVVTQSAPAGGGSAAAKRRPQAEDSATAEAPPAAGFAPPPAATPEPLPAAPPALQEEGRALATDEHAASSPRAAAGSLAKARRQERDEQERSNQEKKAEGPGLGAHAPRTAEEARALREDWRRRASRIPEGPASDEARLRAIEAGALAYRLEGDPQDLEILRRDAGAYLARADARHAGRVRELLRSLGEAP